MPEKVAIVGTGLIGRAWALSFARGGFDVALWDIDETAAERACAMCRENAVELAAHDLLNGESPDVIGTRLRSARTLADALDSVVHVQENGPERLKTKRALASEILGAAPKDAILASSSSALMPSDIFKGLDGRDRCLVAHPVNPPSLIPAVELVPGPDTSVTTMERTARRLQKAGQAPVTLAKELDGFLVNRLQGAVLDEAFRLVGEGYASAEDIDICMRDGLALRWAFMGPFETIDLNAPGGLADYVARYDPMYARLNVGGGPRAPWSGPVLETVMKDRRDRLSQDRLASRSDWRDRHLMRLRAHKRRNGLEGKDRNHE